MDKVFDFAPITSIQELGRNNYYYLIALLAQLSPESVWQYFKMDRMPIDHDLDVTMLTVSLLEPEHSACAAIVKFELQNLLEKQRRTASFVAKQT